MGLRRNHTGDSSHKTRQVRVNVVVTSEPPWYVAKCLENSVASQGNSVEKALTNLKEALELYYEDDEVEAGILEPPQTFLTTLEVALP
jgi:predicted RNase H-like HicB family nuclease